MSIGVLTNDFAFQQAIAASITDVSAPWFIYTSVDELEHQPLELVLWDERQYADTLLGRLALHCPRIICLLPRPERRSLHFGQWPRPYAPLWFGMIPCDPEEFAVLVNGVLKAPTENLIQSWEVWHASQQS
jgi:hypothetical protein